MPRSKMQKELEKRRATRPTVTTQLVQARQTTPQPSFQASVQSAGPARTTGIERMAISERGEETPA